MRKFESYIKKVSNLLTEAPAPPPDEEEDDPNNINFDSEDGMEEDPMNMDQDLPVEGEDDISPADAASAQVSTPQEYELSRIAIKALNADPSKFNPKIFDDFESKRNSEQILNYLETKLGADVVDEPFNNIIAGLAEEGGVDPSQVQGKSISDKLAYYNQNTEDGGMQDTSVEFWTRLILNALKYRGNDYNIGPNVSPENVNAIISKLRQDFNYDVGGMFDKMVKDRVTGSSMKGPGVF